MMDLEPTELVMAYAAKGGVSAEGSENMCTRWACG